MGVMSCSRKCCDNIMCRTYVNEVGYVCSSCQEEFKIFLEKEFITISEEGLTITPQGHSALKQSTNKI